MPLLIVSHSIPYLHVENNLYMAMGGPRMGQYAPITKIDPKGISLILGDDSLPMECWDLLNIQGLNLTMDQLFTLSK